MTTLIERGAIALLNEDEPQRDWNLLAGPAQDFYLSRSRAYLEAIREPTEKSLRTATRMQSFLALAIWQAMIDAELETDK